MLRLQLLVCVAAFALVAGTAQANPYSIQVLRTRAVPGPHVQVTYGVDGRSVPLGSSLETPTLAAAFGIKQTPWVTGGYTSNTGSGLVGLQAIQSCDCFVPMGMPLTYQTTVTDLTRTGTVTITLSSTTTVPVSYATVPDSFDAAPPGDSGPDSFDADVRPDVRPDSGLEVMPWSIPDPVEVQGVDCTSVCPEFTPDASIATPDVPSVTVDAPTPVSDAPTSMLDAPTAIPDAATTTRAPIASPDAPAATPDASTTTSRDSNGCCFGGTGSASGLSLLAVPALLGLRRRRSS